MASNQINLDFGKRSAGIKTELEKRASAMDMSMAKYCKMILIRHVTSGEKFKVVADG